MDGTFSLPAPPPAPIQFPFRRITERNRGQRLFNKHGKEYPQLKPLPVPATNIFFLFCLLSIRAQPVCHRDSFSLKIIHKNGKVKSLPELATGRIAQQSLGKRTNCQVLYQVPTIYSITFFVPLSPFNQQLELCMHFRLMVQGGFCLQVHAMSNTFLLLPMEYIFMSLVFLNHVTSAEVPRQHLRCDFIYCW